MRYVLYARKSSESEDRQVQSIDDQLRILHGVAEQRNLDIVSEIVESKSAKAPGDRPEFNRMMKMLERGEADAILCWSVNRLSRNPVDSGLLSWMLQNGLILSIQTPERTYLPEDNILVFSVETGMANQYILDLKKAVMRGMASKLEKGWFPHRAPEGYTNDLRTHTIEIDPERFPLIQRAWRVLLSEEISIDQLRKRMNEQWGYRTRPTMKSGNKPLSRSSAYRIFTDVVTTHPIFAE